ncbi:MAG: calcium-binding protein [Symploca sp. SIO1C2]|nr:calcium-binding protein [Symploca sp. SIO1C2]
MIYFFLVDFTVPRNSAKRCINDAGVEVVETLINIERLIGSAFDDTLIGDDGNNSLIGNAGADYFDGGDGIDTVSFLENFAITADLSQNRATYIDDTGVEVVETLINIENLIGAAFDDTLIGDNGNNLLRGEAGDDFLDGGDGIDTASFLGSQAGMIANLNQGTATSVNQTEVDTLVNIESLTGSNFDDQLIGDAGNNTLLGLAGDDLLTGGAGADIFNFSSSNQGVDTITDFNSTEGDQIRVFVSGFGNDLTAGLLDAEEFTIGSAATQASDRFIYDDTTGALFFDPDGTGAIAQIQFAQLAVGVALTNSDIFAF